MCITYTLCHDFVFAVLHVSNRLCPTVSIPANIQVLVGPQFHGVTKSRQHSEYCKHGVAGLLVDVREFMIGLTMVNIEFTCILAAHLKFQASNFVKPSNHAAPTIYNIQTSF